MADFGINEMLEMQSALQEKYKGRWENICPETGKNKLLWMIGEIGEDQLIIRKDVLKGEYGVGETLMQASIQFLEPPFEPEIEVFHNLVSLP